MVSFTGSFKIINNALSEHVFCSVEKIGCTDPGHHKSIVHYGRLIQNNIKALCIVGLTRYLLLNLPSSLILGNPTDNTTSRLIANSVV